LLPSGQKRTLGLLVTITLEVAPFRAYAPFPALLQSFKCILVVVFFEAVQQRLRFCLNHLSCFENGDLSIFSYSVGETEKRRVEGWMGDESHFVYGENFPGETESMRQCVVVTQEPVLLSPELGAKSSHIFTQSP
jgi:hypothetical protein